jgi:hypothetical protein
MSKSLNPRTQTGDAIGGISINKPQTPTRSQYGTIKRSSSQQTRINSNINDRPSTAPNKEKSYSKGQSGQSSSFGLNTYAANKRLSTPQRDGKEKVNNLYLSNNISNNNSTTKTKNRSSNIMISKYRSPSPMLKSKSSLNPESTTNASRLNHPTWK